MFGFVYTEIEKTGKTLHLRRSWQVFTANVNLVHIHYSISCANSECPNPI